MAKQVIEKTSIREMAGRILFTASILNNATSEVYFDNTSGLLIEAEAYLRSNDGLQGYSVCVGRRKKFHFNDIPEAIYYIVDVLSDEYRKRGITVV